MTMPLGETAHQNSEDVQARIVGRTGVITLSRPRAMNALNLCMIRTISRHLLQWSSDDHVRQVLLVGGSIDGRPPVFCAGGDIRFFHEAALAGSPQLDDFFTEEYYLDYMIHCYPKPCIVVMDGIVMGGGMGIAQGAAVRIVTERAKLAMPETQIGFFPDVGGGWFLSRCKGSVGEYLAITGASVGAADAIALGLSDFHISSEKLENFVRELLEESVDGNVIDLVKKYSSVPPVSDHPLPLGLIDRHFSLATLKDVVQSLEGDAGEFSQETLECMKKRSPLMMAVTFEQIRRSRGLSLEEVFFMERSLARNCFHIRSPSSSETVEGIRAQVIDKDKQPRWRPSSLQDVTEAMVLEYFESPWPDAFHPMSMLRETEDSIL